MSSTQQGSSNPIRCRKTKAEKSEKQIRRTWSVKEEVVLLQGLKELVANGWKSDNGFRPGFLQRLEESMIKEFPGTDIQVSPHINSKMIVWKKNYGTLSLILSRSGVGFNVDGKHEIDCTDEQWAQIKKCDPNARSMRAKSWPYFEDWKEIFGNDRANGDNAEDYMDAVNSLVQEANKAEDGTEDAQNGEEDAQDGKENAHYHTVDEEISVNEVGENSPCHSEKGASVKVSSKIQKGKKRKGLDNVDVVVDVFREITRGTTTRFETIATRIGYEYDLDKKKRDSFKLVENMPGLSLDQKLDVCIKLVKDHDLLLMFEGLPESTRVQYVQRLLKQ